jgi:hypothetical protein
MAERHKVQKADGMKRALPLQVFFDLSLKRREVRQQVPVREDHALRVSRGARSEDDLGYVVEDRVYRISVARVMRDPADQLFYGDSRQGQARLFALSGAVEDQSGFDLSLDPADEFRRAFDVERDGDHAARQAPEESGDPLGAVFGPEQNAVAFAYPATFKLAGEPKSGLSHIQIRPPINPQPATMRESRLAGAL